MKKIVYLLSALALTFTACDPMEDVYNELDEIAAEKGDAGITVNKTLVAADYQFFKTPAPAVASRSAFASEDQALELLPSFLDSKFPQLKEGAAVNVTFNQTLYPSLSSAVSTSARVTVSNADYTALGETGNRFDNEATDLAAYLAYKYSATNTPANPPVERQLVAVTYKLPDPADNTRSITAKKSFLYLNGAWKSIFHVSDADYASTGNGQFNNFDESNSNAVLLSYFNQFLKNYYTNNKLAAKTGDVQYVSYTFYNGSSSQRFATMIFDGTNWVDGPSWVVNVAQMKSNTLKFKKTNGAWVVDLTLTYVLPRADYNWIGIDNPNPNYGTAANRANVAQFGSFFTQFPTDARYWSQDEINKSMIALIKHRFPTPKEGIKFEMVYKVYNGSTVNQSSFFRKNDAGEYEVYKP